MTFDAFLATLWQLTLRGSVVILLVLAVRTLLKKAPRAAVYALWGVALFRLLCPLGPPAPVSVFNLLPTASGLAPFAAAGSPTSAPLPPAEAAAPRPDAAPAQAVAEQQNVLYDFDTANGGCTELLRWQQGERQIQVDARQPYYLYEMRPGGGCTLQKRDLCTGEYLPWQQTIPTTIPRQAILGWMGGGYLQVTAYNVADNGETAERHELLLTYPPKDVPYTVRAVTGQQFLVSYAEEAAADGGPAWPTARLGLIDQQDLVNNIDDVTPIEEPGNAA